MKNKIKCLPLSISLLLTVFTGCNPIGGSSSIEPELALINREIPLILPNGEGYDFKVSYLGDYKEVLLVELNYVVKEFITDLLMQMGTETYIDIKETDTSFTMTRENSAKSIIDYRNKTIYFSDFDLFHQSAIQVNPHDLLAFPYLNDDGEARYLKRESNMFIKGDDTLIDFKERGIPLYLSRENKKYIPLQTFSDLYLYPYGFNLAYNGTNIFLLPGHSLPEGFETSYYHSTPSDKSKALARFNYEELCLFLDLYYGLKEEHGITNGFDDYFVKTGLKEQLLSVSPLVNYNGLMSFAFGYISDSHTGLTSGSPYLGTNHVNEGKDFIISEEIFEKIQIGQTYRTIRENILGEVPFYQKVDNTAYITFDSFTTGDRSGEYTEEGLSQLDTFYITYVSHMQIMNDPEIENVVLDLSCNSGGTVDSAIYLTAWLLGNCQFSIKSTLNNSKAITTYKADVNFDGEFNEQDTVADKNLYCLISPVSFSCGNFVPALLKKSGNVTLLGQKSSGGTCVVGNVVTADGSFLSISSYKQFSLVENGSFYGVDRGVTPHIALDKIESFYNREALKSYINNIL